MRLRRPSPRAQRPGGLDRVEAIDDALLTIPQLRARYGGSPMTWYRRARAGELPGAVRLGNRWYVRRLVLEAWLAGEDVGGGAVAEQRLRAV